MRTAGKETIAAMTERFATPEEIRRADQASAFFPVLLLAVATAPWLIPVVFMLVEATAPEAELEAAL